MVKNDKDNGTKKEIIEEIPRGSDEIGGKIEMSQSVVETIAGLAAREIVGIHSLGKSRLISIGNNPQRGISAEVGKTEAALDIEVIINYGSDIRKTAKALRQRVAQEVERMAGRKVVEININVVGIDVVPEEPEIQTSARVQ